MTLVFQMFRQKLGQWSIKKFPTHTHTHLLSNLKPVPIILFLFSARNPFYIRLVFRFRLPIISKRIWAKCNVRDSNTITSICRMLIMSCMFGWLLVVGSLGKFIMLGLAKQWIFSMAIEKWEAFHLWANWQHICAFGTGF